MGSHVLPALTEDPMDLDRPWWLRMLRHSPDLTIAGYAVAIGGVTLGRAVKGGQYVSPPLQHMPSALAGVIAGIVLVGGLVTIIGVLLRMDNLKVELGIETAGWFIMHVGWVAYIYAAYQYSEVTGPVAAIGVLAVGCLARVVALAVHLWLLRRQQVRDEKVVRLIRRIEDGDV